MRRDFGTLGRAFFHLYAISGGGSQWIAKACPPSASEGIKQGSDEEIHQYANIIYNIIDKII